MMTHATTQRPAVSSVARIGVLLETAAAAAAVAVAAGTMPISSALGTYEVLGSGRERINDQVV